MSHKKRHSKKTVQTTAILLTAGIVLLGCVLADVLFGIDSMESWDYLRKLLEDLLVGN